MTAIVPRLFASKRAHFTSLWISCVDVSRFAGAHNGTFLEWYAVGPGVVKRRIECNKAIHIRVIAIRASVFTGLSHVIIHPVENTHTLYVWARFHTCAISEWLKRVWANVARTTLLHTRNHVLVFAGTTTAFCVYVGRARTDGRGAGAARPALRPVPEVAAVADARVDRAGTLHVRVGSARGR